MFKKVGCKTPRFRKPTPPPAPNPNYTPPPSVVKTNPPNVGSSVQHPKKPCTYETPCGWCTKWDKECDRKIDKAKKYTDERLNYDLHYECLKKTLERDIKEIKVTSGFRKYLEKRYLFSLTSDRPAHCFYPECKFMGIPVVVDDGIESSYAIVFKKEDVE
jgi:hypothetical protein